MFRICEADKCAISVGRECSEEKCSGVFESRYADGRDRPTALDRSGQSGAANDVSAFYIHYTYLPTYLRCTAVIKAANSGCKLASSALI